MVTASGLEDYEDMRAVARLHDVLKRWDVVVG